MPPDLRVAYLAHSIRSDWNNGNAHFLRGLLQELQRCGSEVCIFEPNAGWSYSNLVTEPLGIDSVAAFERTYPDLAVTTYTEAECLSDAFWLEALRGVHVVILHEWNSAALSQTLLTVRDGLAFKLLFHDTHHRASSSPESIKAIGVESFDGVLAFGNALADIYKQTFGIEKVWTLHEAADTSVFTPRETESVGTDVVWVGNWGDDERSREIHEFLIDPAMALPEHSFTVYGVRYPPEAVYALDKAGVRYGGYLPNLAAPAAYGNAKLTLHIPRQQYSKAMKGIPTIRVFEALACGIPLISAPWDDAEELFREGDFLFVQDGVEMQRAMRRLLSDAAEREALAARGLETVLERHTCRHRALQLAAICKEVLQ